MTRCSVYSIIGNERIVLYRTACTEQSYMTFRKYGWNKWDTRHVWATLARVLVFTFKKILKIGDSGAATVSDEHMLKAYFFRCHSTAEFAAYSQKEFDNFNIQVHYKITDFLRRRDMRKRGVIKIEIFIILWYNQFDK